MLLPTLLLAIRITPDSPEMPFKQPQVATDGLTVGLAFGSSDAVYFARSTDQGTTFSKPIRVSRGGKLSLGMHRGPRIAMTPEAIVVSAIVGEKGRGADGDLVSWRSTDGGETWSTGVKVNDVAGSAREGLHAMAAGGGVVFSAWLDLRDKGTRLYGSASRDGGQTWSKNMLVYESPSGTICQCCHPSVAVDIKGQITVMFRNSLDGSRDIYVARSTDRGQTFSRGQKLGQGTWVLNACPMDGGGVSVAGKGQLVSVWRREKDIFTASENGPEKKIGTGKDPSVAVGKAGVYVAWTFASAVHALIPGRMEPVIVSSDGGYPQLLVLPNGRVLAAWESKGDLAVDLLP